MKQKTPLIIDKVDVKFVELPYLKMKLEIKRERIRMLIEQKKFIQKQLDVVENEMFKLEDELEKQNRNESNTRI